MDNCKLDEIISKLPATRGHKAPSYDALYPEHWANDKEVEDRHRDIVRKLQTWPIDEGNKVSYRS
jgi:hypothetical protein